MLRLLPSLAMLFVATSALAADAPSSPEGKPTLAGSLAFAVTRGLHEDWVPESGWPPFGGWPSRDGLNLVEINGTTIRLEETLMATAASLIGAPLRREGEAGEANFWACLGAEGHTLWLESDGEMGDDRVQSVMLERSEPAPAWGCGTAEALPHVVLSVPGLGTARANIEAEFGEISDAVSAVGYRFDKPSPRIEDFYESAEVVYHFADGEVVAVAITQETWD